jgi:hypothetical protein
MTYHLTLFSILVCAFWLTFLWWTARPTLPRQESRYEILEEPQIEPQLESQIEPESVEEPTVYNSEELKAIMQKRDPFRRVK